MPLPPRWRAILSGPRRRRPRRRGPRRPRSGPLRRPRPRRPRGPRAASSARPSSSGRPRPSSAARRSASIVSCGKPARPSAISSARSRWSPGGDDLGQQAHRERLPGATMRPVRMRSSARPRPTMRGRRCVPPSISGTPQRRSGKPSVEPRPDDAQVAPQRELEAAGQAPAADRGDRRLATAVRRVKPSGPVGRVEALGEGLDRLEVGARAERDAAGAGEDQHARVVVGLEARRRPRAARGGRPVDGVAALRAVDGQDRGGADPLVADLVDRVHRRANAPRKGDGPARGISGRGHAGNEEGARCPSGWQPGPRAV